MTLSISCPNCGKQFRNIKPEMAGRRARCSCGTVVRLGPKSSRNEGLASNKSTSENRPADLQTIDLVGDELLGDQLLGGDLSEDQPPHKEPSTPVVIEVPVVAVPPSGLAHPTPEKFKRQKPPSRTQGPRSSATDGNRKSVVDEAYGDLDEILSGHGDAAPLVVAPRSVSPATPENPSQGSGVRRKRRPSIVGFLAALGSATVASCFGVLIVVSRFQIVDFPLLSGFSETLQSVYLAVFGMADVTKTFQQLFVSLGWALWFVGIALVFFALAQFLNAFVRILFGRSLMGWSDGMTAAMGVCAMFLMVAMVFGHTSFIKQQNRLLDEYEKPTVLDRGPIGNIDLLRAEVNEEGTTFQSTMLVGAALPASIFMLSMVRLFLKIPDQDRETG